jgi:Icc-related predicted phosphoesterase
MRKRIRRQRLRLRRAGGVDIVLTHAAPQGLGDDDDYAHRGFEAFIPLIDRERPSYLVHGHVHMNYGSDIPRVEKRGPTSIVNAYERYLLEI